jgi:polyisoprenoid-binding protein YceI
MIKFLLLILLFPSAYAKKYQFQDYDQASKAKEFVKFQSESTKFGILTTEFDGYAKEYDMQVSIKKNKIIKVEFSLNPKMIDTDNSSRDEKMREQTLEVEKFTTISFVSTESFELTPSSIEISGSLTIREITKKALLTLKISKDGEKWLIEGSTQISLKEFQIPNPSILIAKVRDQFDISFKVSIDEK